MTKVMMIHCDDNVSSRPLFRVFVAIFMENIRVVLADDQQLFVESLKTVIEARSENIEVVGIAYNGKEAIRLVQKITPPYRLDGCSYADDGWGGSNPHYLR